LKGKQVADLRIEAHGRQRLRRARKLQLRLLEMVGVEMGVTQRMDEVARLQARHLCHHHRQQRIGSDVEGFSGIVAIS